MLSSVPERYRQLSFIGGQFGSFSILLLAGSVLTISCSVRHPYGAPRYLPAVPQLILERGVPAGDLCCERVERRRVLHRGFW